MVGEVWKGPTTSATGLWLERQPGALLGVRLPAALRPGAGAGGGESGKRAGGGQRCSMPAGTVENYPNHAMPNLMLGNHDLVRFGDLLERGNFNQADYWQRHRRPSASWRPAPVPSPSTGEEFGDEVPGFAAQVGGDCAAQGLCDDHVARSDGKGARCHRLRPERRAGRAQAVAGRAAGPTRQSIPPSIRGAGQAGGGRQRLRRSQTDGERADRLPAQRLQHAPELQPAPWPSCAAAAPWWICRAASA